MSKPNSGDRALFDLHCHGAAGHTFGDDEAGSRAAAAYLAGHGIRCVASLVSASPERLGQQVRILAPLVADGTVAGIHLEGPFLSPQCRGAHHPQALMQPDPAVVPALVEAVTAAGAPGAIVQMTFAPELPGADDVARVLAEHGIIPAIGHTAASASQISRSVARIADLTGRPALITHLFNGMPPFHHRDGGPAAAALAAAGRGEAVVELIADGRHVAPEVVRMVFDVLSPERITLVSDGIAATGLGDGDYLLGEVCVRVSAGAARLSTAGPGQASLAGSTSTLADCVAWAGATAGVPAAAALSAATTTPAAVLRAR